MKDARLLLNDDDGVRDIGAHRSHRVVPTYRGFEVIGHAITEFLVDQNCISMHPVAMVIDHGRSSCAARMQDTRTCLSASFIPPVATAMTGVASVGAARIFAAAITGA